MRQCDGGGAIVPLAIVAVGAAILLPFLPALSTVFVACGIFAWLLGSQQIEVLSAVLTVADFVSDVVMLREYHGFGVRTGGWGWFYTAVLLLLASSSLAASAAFGDGVIFARENDLLSTGGYGARTSHGRRLLGCVLAFCGLGIAAQTVGFLRRWRPLAHGSPSEDDDAETAELQRCGGFRLVALSQLRMMLFESLSEGALSVAFAIHTGGLTTSSHFSWPLASSLALSLLDVAVAFTSYESSVDPHFPLGGGYGHAVAIFLYRLGEFGARALWLGLLYRTAGARAIAILLALDLLVVYVVKLGLRCGTGVPQHRASWLLCPISALFVHGGLDLVVRRTEDGSWLGADPLLSRLRGATFYSAPAPFYFAWRAGQSAFVAWLVLRQRPVVREGAGSGAAEPDRASSLLLLQIAVVFTALASGSAAFLWRLEGRPGHGTDQGKAGATAAGASGLV